MFKHVHPDYVAHRVTDVQPEELLELGISGVILDLDNTLTLWNSDEVTPEVRAWVDQVRAAGLQACVVSNAVTTLRVCVVADALGIPWVTRALKPLPFGFRRGMRLMRTTPATTAVIGDQMFTDIWGGNRLGLFTILVDPISPHEAFFTRLIQRSLERLVGRDRRE